MYLKSDSIIVGRSFFRNTSLVLHCYTSRWGIVTALAKGAFRRRRRSEPPSVPDLFERGEVVAYMGPRRDLAILREWTLEDMRRGIRSDYSAFRAAAGCVAVVRGLARDFGRSGEHFEALDRALADLDGGARPRAVLWGFALRALARAGFLAPLDGCAACGRPFGKGGAEAAGLSGHAGGLVCRQCRAARAEGAAEGAPEGGADAFVALPAEAAAGARFLAGSERAARTLKASPRAARAIERAIRAFIEYTLERPTPALAPD